MQALIHNIGKEDFYIITFAFLFYSFLGWLIESIYLSISDKKIINTGFARGPICPIYGFGAILGSILLNPIKNNAVALFFAGAIIATIFEYIVGTSMNRVFGKIWWSYENKPFNYKNIICLESTIAWGVYAIAIVKYMNDMVIKVTSYIGIKFGSLLCMTAVIVLLIDYYFQLKKRM